MIVLCYKCVGKFVLKEDTNPSDIVGFGKKLCRHEFYQKPDEVVVTIFAKGISKENIAVNFGEQIVCFIIL